MTTSPTDNTQQLLAYLQAWRQYLEQGAGAMAPAQLLPPAAPGLFTTLPTAPLAPPPMPSAAASQPMTFSPIDYTLQLLTCLQAWRQYLEQAMGVAAPGRPLYPTAPPAPTTATAPPCPTTPPPPATTTATTAGQSGPASSPTSSAVEIVRPSNPFQSELVGPLMADPSGRPSPGPSLYDPARSTAPLEVRSQSGSGSAYSQAASAAPTGASAQVESPSLYSDVGAGTSPGQEHKGESLEIVAPFQDLSR